MYWSVIFPPAVPPRYVRPVLFDMESAESNDPEELLNFEVDLLAVIIKTGVKTKKEVTYLARRSFNLI